MDCLALLALSMKMSLPRMQVLYAQVLLLLAYIPVASTGGGNWPHDQGPIRRLQCHDSSSVPDHVLRLSHETISIGCQTRPSVVINGTVPGPEVRLVPGKTS